MSTSLRIDIWSDIVCPFCYIGKKRLEHVAEQAGIPLDVHWHSYELDPNAPASHDSSNTERLAKKYGKSVAEMEQFQRQMADMAASEGIDFQWQMAQSGNSFNAHRIIQLAKKYDLADQAEEEFFKAYMTEGLAIGKREVVEQVAARIGLKADEVKAVLDSDQYAAHVRQDEQIARQIGISGVPFFIINQKLAISGAQPREVFLQTLQQASTSADDTPTQDSAAAAMCTDETCEIPPK